jgi:hypothetical protein
MKSVRDLVLLSANCRKPQQEELVNLIEALNRGVEDMGNARSGNKKERDWAAHLAFVAEGGPVVGWVQTVSAYGPTFLLCDHIHVYSRNLQYMSEMLKK